MDKYEFNIKVEQIKKLVNKGDYETAMKIADTIDWRRVRSANLLALVAEIYENNEEYQEAKEILLLAFERAPIGKRLLYKLADLALKENNLREAEDYYREFCDLAPEDSRQHLLRYQILKAKKAPDEQLIHSLERYTNTELDEKWLYELAELYSRAGKEEECIQTCDKIMLMFGLGKFVDKAMQLKVQYAPLSSYQMDLIENRDKYEEKLRAVEQGYIDEPNEEYSDEYENEGRDTEPHMERRPQPEYRQQMAEKPEDNDEMYQDQADPVRTYAKPAIAPERYEDQEVPVRTYSKPQPVAGVRIEPEVRIVQEEPPAVPDDSVSEMEIRMETDGNPYQIPEEELEARIHQAETEARLAQEMSKIAMDEYKRPDSPLAQTKVIGSIREILTNYSLTPGSGPGVNYLMIETCTPDKGLELAVEVLKHLHKEKGSKNQVVKISGSKLSHKGVMESSDKLAGKDLIIEGAGDLTVVALIELQDFIEESEEDIRVIMIDKPRQIESMARVNPSLGALFSVITIKDNGELEIRRLVPPKAPEDAPAVQVVEEAEAGPEQIMNDMINEMMEEPVIQETVIEEPVMAEPVVEEPTVEVQAELAYEPYQEEPPAELKEEDNAAAMAEFMKMMDEPSQSPVQPVAEPEIPYAGLSTEIPAPMTQSIPVEPYMHAGMTPMTEMPAADMESVPMTPVNSIPVAPTAPVMEPEAMMAASMTEAQPMQQPYSTSNISTLSPNEEMELHEFVEYTCKYASDIDCSITGKSMLALYERIEVMEENGVPLTRINAENLIEEAADKAEKFSFKKLFTGLFHPRYDKEGLLILREEHFMS